MKNRISMASVSVPVMADILENRISASETNHRNRSDH